MAESVRRRSWGGVLPLGRHASISGSSLIHCASVSMAPPRPRGAKRPSSQPLQARTGPSILRRTRLAVVDEVANGLSYFDATFLRELPRFYAGLEDQLAATDPSWTDTELPSFLRIGSWIGGDRDGNPFVTADVLRQALRMQSKRALTFYLDEVHQLGGELSLDGRLVRVSEPLRGLAEQSPDRSLHRRDEPYRRAMSGIYARLAATAASL